MSFADAAARLVPHHHGQRVGSSELGLLVLSELVGAYIQGVLPEMQLRGVPFPCAALLKGFALLTCPTPKSHLAKRSPTL